MTFCAVMVVVDVVVVEYEARIYWREKNKNNISLIKKEEKEEVKTKCKSIAWMVKIL